MGYILNVIHHFPELIHQTRSLSSLYGVIGELARLTTEAGNLEATLALYTFIPLRDRRLSPWSIIAKQMAPGCAAFGLGHPAVIEAPHLVGMKGRRARLTPDEGRRAAWGSVRRHVPSFPH